MALLAKGSLLGYGMREVIIGIAIGILVFLFVIGVYKGWLGEFVAQFGGDNGFTPILM